MSGDSPASFTTKKRRLTTAGDLSWGDSEGEQWSDAIDSSTGVTITDTGTVQTGPDIPASGVSYWTCDDADTETNTSIDTWGNNDAIINGGSTGVSGATQTYSTNNAYKFNGGGEYLDTTITESPMETGDATYCLWAKLIDTTSSGAFFRQQGSHVISYNRNGNNQFKVATWGNNTGSFGPTITDTNWHHYVFKRVGSTYYVYVDGGNETTATGGTPSSSSNPLGVTGYSGGDNLPVVIDDVRLYNTALTATEVFNLYETGTISN